MNLYEDERLDYLLAQDMKIIQSPSVFNFSLDAVLLADFAWVPIQKGIYLICVQVTRLFLLLSTRTKGNITGVEIQERLYDMGVRSVQYNGLEERIHLIHGDLKDMPRNLDVINMMLLHVIHHIFKHLKLQRKI